MMDETEAGERCDLRILIVDDQRLLREGLRILLELHTGIRVVGEAGDGIEGERLVAALNPDVVLMDLRMPRRDGVAATRRISQRFPDVPVLVLTTFDEDELVFEALEAGAVGYLLKDIGSDALADAIRAAVRGESPLQPSIARKLVARVRRPALSLTVARPPGEPLTAREVEVLRLLAEGASNREIAGRLSLTEGTVKNYLSAILAKTGLRDRTQAALFAVRHGLAG